MNELVAKATLGFIRAIAVKSSKKSCRGLVYEPTVPEKLKQNK